MTPAIELPARTPKWAIGVVVIVISAFSSFVTSYLAVSPDIKHYIDAKQIIAAKEMEVTAAIVDKSLSSIASITEANQKSITQLYETISTMRYDKTVLEARVSSLEKEVVVISANLDSCSERLTRCESKLTTTATTPAK